MSKWLALARNQGVPKSNSVPKCDPDGVSAILAISAQAAESEPARKSEPYFGDFGTIGTHPASAPDLPARADEQPIGTIGTNGTAPPVSPHEVRALFDLAVRRLMQDHERDRDRAERDALDHVRSSLRNDPRLAPEQRDTHHCLICGGRDAPHEGNPLLPFLSAVHGEHHWVHSRGCHDQHVRRQAEKADRCMQAAGLPKAK